MMDDDEKYIELICNGEFNAVPDFKIGELFESFFDNINYNVIKENDSAYVDFTGEAYCDDEPCTIVIRFLIDDKVENFEIKQVKVNEDILNEVEILDLLEDIAFAGGATFEDESNCDSDCSSCNHKCGFFDENDEDNNSENDGNYDDTNE